MTVPVHQPPSPIVVAALVRAGITRNTALAMEGWKAEEVLELLRAHHADAESENEVLASHARL